MVTRYPVSIDGETVMVGTAAELAVTLDVLQGQHDRAVLTQLRPHLAEVVDSPIGFANVVKSLAAADQVYLIEALGPRLVEIIGGANHLRDLLASMAVIEVEVKLLDTLGSAGLRTLIATPQELAEVLEWVYGECDERVLALLGGEHLRQMFANGYELSVVLNSLDEARQMEVIENLGWEHVVGLVASGRDLAYLLRALPAQVSKDLLGHYSRERLVQLIGNERDWEYLCRRLEADEARYLYRLLGVEGNA